MSVTSSILQRTFHIRYNRKAGTCFTIDVQGRRYLITARHVVDTIRDDAIVDISQNRQWKQLRVRLVGHSAGRDRHNGSSTSNVVRGITPATPHYTRSHAGRRCLFSWFPLWLAYGGEDSTQRGFPLAACQEGRCVSTWAGRWSHAP